MMSTLLPIPKIKPMMMGSQLIALVVVTVDVGTGVIWLAPLDGVVAVEIGDKVAVASPS